MRQIAQGKGQAFAIFTAGKVSWYLNHHAGQVGVFTSQTSWSPNTTYMRRSSNTGRQYGPPFNQ
eukprot:2143589-Amphidinium_carterae.1